MAIRHLYIDGTNGFVGGLGDSWTRAMRTLPDLEDRISRLLEENPLDTQFVVHIRGAFAAHAVTALNLTIELQGTSSIVIGQDVADMTVVDAGTVFTVNAATEKHGLTNFVLTTAVVGVGYLGRILLLTDAAANVGTATIVDVNAGTNTIWCSLDTYPGWVIGGDVVTAQILQPSVTGITGINISVERPGMGLAGGLAMTALIGAIETDNLTVSGEGTIAIGPAMVTGAGSSLMIRSGSVLYFDSTVMSANDVTSLVALGYLSAGANGFTSMGPNMTQGNLVCSDASAIIQGYFSGVPTVISEGSLGLRYAHSNGALASNGSLSILNCIVRNQVLLTSNSALSFENITYGVLPAVGVSNGLVYVQSGKITNFTNVEGVNLPTGAPPGLLYGVHLDGPNSSADGMELNDVRGQDGDLRIANGARGSVAAWNIPPNPGLGPDIFVGDNSSVHFLGNVVKTATNPSAAFAANSVLEACRCSTVTQAPASNFTLPAGSGDHTTDYGANGALNFYRQTNVSLGVLTGAGGGTTNMACSIRTGSSLSHGGAGIAGVTPIVIGGAAIAAWPGAVTTDIAAGIPELCTLYL